MARRDFEKLRRRRLRSAQLFADGATQAEVARRLQVSRVTALRWYRAAAARGHPLAQYNLAVMYEDGEGVTQDLVEAYKWYTLAARGGFYGTERGSRELLAPRLSARQIEKGRELAQRFEPIE